MESILLKDACPRCGQFVKMNSVTEDENIQWGDTEYTIRSVKSLSCPACKGKVVSLKEANRVADLAQKQHEKAIKEKEGSKKGEGKG